MTTHKHFDTQYDFKSRASKIVAKGLSGFEPIGRWSEGHNVSFSLYYQKAWPPKPEIKIALRPYVSELTGKQNLAIKVNGSSDRFHEFTTHFESTEIVLYPEIDEADLRKPLRFEVKVEYPTSPASHTNSTDTRLLGALFEHVKVSGTYPARSPTPYDKLEDYRFWNRSISGQDANDLNPVVNPRFKISETDKVGTAGSCFAQHISRRIVASGFNYLITETGGDLSALERAKRQFGVYSARYGNIYTPAQLLQLWEEAFEGRIPVTRTLKTADGRYVDASRQQVEPTGFSTHEEALEDRAHHLAAVKELFENVDIFVFTLGLTEAWVCKQDGSILSAAPGVVAGEPDDSKYEFVNFTLEQTFGYLDAFLTRFHAVNPHAKVLLTVSPVPLMATYENKSVLTSTIYSKSVLRVAAEQAVNKYDWVDYFPSYEIITGPPTGGMYFEQDFRSVAPRGVSHVMRCFQNSFLNISNDKLNRNIGTINLSENVICDEEILAHARGDV